LFNLSRYLASLCVIMPSPKIAVIVVVDMSCANDIISMLATQNRNVIMDGFSHTITGTMDVADCGLFVWANTGDMSFDAMFDEPKHGSVLSRLQFDTMSTESLSRYVNAGALKCWQVPETNSVSKLSNESSVLQLTRVDDSTVEGDVSACVDACIKLGQYPHSCSCPGFPSLTGASAPWHRYFPFEGHGLCRKSVVKGDSYPYSEAGADCLETNDCIEIYTGDHNPDACSRGCDMDPNCAAYSYMTGESRAPDKCFLYWGLPEQYGCVSRTYHTQCYIKGTQPTCKIESDTIVFDQGCFGQSFETECRGSRQFDGKTQTILVRGVTANIPIGGVLDCQFGRDTWGGYQVLPADECTRELRLKCDQDGPDGEYLGPYAYKEKYKMYQYKWPFDAVWPEPRLRQLTTDIELMVTDDWVKSERCYR